jgi:hypothetical protein
MIATQELVVPKSIPITSPASAEDEDCHRRATKGEEYEAAAADDSDGTCVCDSSALLLLWATTDAKPRPEEDAVVAAAEKPRRRDSCSAMVSVICRCESSCEEEGCCCYTCVFRIGVGWLMRRRPRAAVGKEGRRKIPRDDEETDRWSWSFSCLMSGPRAESTSFVTSKVCPYPYRRIQSIFLTPCTRRG